MPSELPGEPLPDPLAELCAQLRVLRRVSGDPSLRDIAKAVGASHTTVGELLNGTRCPSWEIVSRVALHLGGDVTRFKRLWVAVRNTVDPLPATGGPAADESSPMPLMKIDRSNGPRSDVLWIYDPSLARQVLESFFRADEQGNTDG